MSTGQRPGFVTRQNYQLLESIEKDLARLREQLALAAECVGDCQVFRELADDFAGRLARLRRNFFDPPPL